MLTRPLLALTIIAPLAAPQRERLPLDADWRFLLGDPPGYAACVANASFPLPLDGVEGDGLQPMGVVADEDACMGLCCASSACQLYNFCPPSNAAGCSGSPPSSCWTGSLSGALRNGTLWVGRGRTAPLPPPPSATGPETRAFDDGAWRQLRVPHDFVVEGAYVNDSALEGHGYLAANVSWYRRHFAVDAAWSGDAVWVDFDGVFRASDVWLNGAYLGHHESGYTSFRYYLHNATDPFTGQPALLFGGADNVLAVRLDGRDFEGWWCASHRTRRAPNCGPDDRSPTPTRAPHTPQVRRRGHLSPRVSQPRQRTHDRAMVGLCARLCRRRRICAAGRRRPPVFPGRRRHQLPGGREQRPRGRRRRHIYADRLAH